MVRKRSSCVLIIIALIPSLHAGAQRSPRGTFLFHHRVRFNAKPRSGPSAQKGGGDAFGPRKALGRKRAAYWRSLSFPNLVKARKVSARNRRARKQLFAEAKSRNPFALQKTPCLLIIEKISRTRKTGGRGRKLPSHNEVICELGGTVLL